MCGTCGCSSTEHAIGGHTPPTAADERRVIALEADLLAKNDAIATANRRRLEGSPTLALNLMSSPGAGKTTLLVATIAAIAGRVEVAVVEGDQASDEDARRIRATGVPALQVNTGRGCHLDAAMIARALDAGIAPSRGVLFIENVGNLVCPAGFDLGEARKVVVASVTEGEDKPLKYPDVFAAADLVLVNKCDLLPHLRFDVERLIANCRRASPRVEVLRVSAEAGTGLDAWVDWIEHARSRLATAA